MEDFTYSPVAKSVPFKSVGQRHFRLVIVVFCLVNIENNMQLKEKEERKSNSIV